MDSKAAQIFNSLAALGYPLFDLMLVGLRGQQEDSLVVLEQLDGERKMTVFVINLGGLAARFYPDCWQLGAYQNRYLSLVSRSPLGIDLCHDEPDPYTLQRQIHRSTAQILRVKADLRIIIDKLLDFSQRNQQQAVFSYAVLDESALALPLAKPKKPKKPKGVVA